MSIVSAVDQALAIGRRGRSGRIVAEPTSVGPLEFSPAEQAIMDHIEAAQRGIQELGLRGNAHELAHATHTLQLFVVKHALQRLHFKGMSRWFWKD